MDFTIVSDFDVFNEKVAKLHIKTILFCVLNIIYLLFGIAHCRDKCGAATVAGIFGVSLIHSFLQGLLFLRIFTGIL